MQSLLSAIYLAAISTLAAAASSLYQIVFYVRKVPCLSDFRSVRKFKMRRKDSAMDTTELFKRHARQQAKEAAGSLDVKVLGIRCRSGLNKLDFALVHYRQQTPDSPLRVEFLRVRL
jgi:cephalosporin-C deacetylase-like acetyl esterase